jgi:hypothetical protein
MYLFSPKKTTPSQLFIHKLRVHFRYFLLVPVLDQQSGNHRAGAVAVNADALTAIR